VKRSGTQLSQHVYAFLTYVQTAEQETRGKEKTKTFTKVITELFALESHFLPLPVFPLEDDRFGWVTRH
jgi:hypothetical protein